MAKQGILGQTKPASTTNTLLYSAPIDAAASAVLQVYNRAATASDYDVAVKNFDQKLTLNASTYLLHEGDVITSYRFGLGSSIAGTVTLNSGTVLTSTDGEATAKFESFYIPEFTEIDVKEVGIRIIPLESVSGSFAIGETFSKGTSPNDTTATIYHVDGTNIYIGPSTLNGTGTEFAAGDSVASSGGGGGTITTDGPGASEDEFVFQPSGGTYYDLYLNSGIPILKDRAYRFDVSDSSMTGRDFKLSDVVNGEWGPDGVQGNADDGGEYTTGKTTNGTAGSAGAYVQYDFSQETNAALTTLYYYDGGTGTPANADYGGSDRFVTLSTTYSYDEIYVYDITGTWTTNTDGFTLESSTYTVSSQTSGAYGYVRSYDSTTLYVIKGTGSADFAATDTFRDVPKSTSTARSTVTVSSVDVATTALEDQNYVARDNELAADTRDTITSLVVGPGERVYVESSTGDVIFNLIGFEDLSTQIAVRHYND